MVANFSIRIRVVLPHELELVLASSRSTTESFMAVAASKGVALEACEPDLHFGQQSQLREAARRLSTAQAGEVPWRRLAEDPDCLQRVIDDLIGLCDRTFRVDAERELAHHRVQELLKQRSGTECHGFDHLRKLVDEIHDSFSLRTCRDW